MAIPLCGTFDYIAVVPGEKDRAAWKAHLRKPIELTGSHETDDRLVGHSPSLEISDAGITPEVRMSGLAGKARPWVLRSRITLTATARKHALLASVTFHVDRALVMALTPGDTLFMTRSAGAGLALSIVRDGQLVAGVGAVSRVPLGDHVHARIPFDVVNEAEAVFRKYDPHFRFGVLPVEIRAGEQTTILNGGRLRIESYEVFVEHGFSTSASGSDECVAVSLVGTCPEVAAISSAQLLDSPDPLEMVRWSA